MKIEKTVIVSITKDFTETPGGRLINEGAKSAEEFVKELVAPHFGSQQDYKIRIELDGTAGVCGSFLDEAFTRIGKLGVDSIHRVDVVSNEEPIYREWALAYIREANGKD